MAISVDWATKVVSISKADTTLVDSGPPEIRQLDVDTFRLALKALEANVEGMPFVKTHVHNTEYVISGITYARSVQIVNGYTVTFEPGAYGVDIVGANNNIMDVLNMNATQLRGNNSAGLINVGLTQTDAEVVADAVWNEILTGLTHNVQHSAGKMLRELAGKIIHTGTAQGPGTGFNQIQFATDASAIDGSYDPSAVVIVDGAGAGQSRLVFQYAGSTRMATVDRDWKILPDATSEYIIYGNPGREHVNEGLAQGGTSDTITLNTLASSYDGAYERQTIFIRSGTGEDQVRIVLSYDGTTKVAIVDEPWDVVPDTQSGYVVLPTRDHTLETLYSSQWNAVYINTVNGKAGTAFPLGSAGNPVDNITDAKIIADNHGIKCFKVYGIVTLDQDYGGYCFEGSGSVLSDVVILNSKNVLSAKFERLTVTGIMFGTDVSFIESFLSDISGIDGILFDCGLNGTIGMDGGGGSVIGKNCAGASQPTIIDMVGAGRTWQVAFDSGKVKYINAGSGSIIHTSHRDGLIELDVSCTDGDAIIRGGAKVTDNSSMTVLDQTTTEASITDAVWDEPASEHVIDGSLGQMVGKKLLTIAKFLGLK